MSVRISQSEDQATGRTIVRVEGALTAESAELLNGICASLMKKSDAQITINVSNVSSLDKDAAAVLRCLKRQGICFDGCELFTKRVVESTEL